jgi:TrmH family RNA methyltransferase
MNGTPINSSSNPTFLLQQKVLKNKSFRKKEALIWLEGQRAISQCPADKIKALFLGPNAPTSDKWPVPPYQLSKDLAKKVFDTESPQEVGCLLNWQPSPLEELNWQKGVIILDGLMDPGNAGSILRTASALDFGGLVLLESIEFGNPKLLRASAGCLFSVPLHESDKREDLQNFIKEKNISCTLADAGGQGKALKKSEGPYCLIVGSEAHGLGPGWKGQRWSLPLANEVESLNAAVAAALLAFQLKQI